MKSIRIATVLLASLLLAAPALAGQHEHSTHGGHAGHGGLSLEERELPPAPIPTDSIFQLESLWTLPDGSQVPLSSLGGRVQVLAMIYTHCEHACPRIIADMRRVANGLGDAEGKVGFTLVSFDPDRDDAARLTEFARKTGLEAWTLLRAEDGSVRELAAALGLRYRKVNEEDFVHSNMISVLDADGVVVHRQVGLGVDPQASLAAIRGLLEEQPAARE